MRRYPLLLASLLLAVATSASAATDAGNPYNSAVRRANPNSMQGTRPVTPTSPNLQRQVNPQPPTLQNGRIGNGNNLRPAPSAPVAPSPPVPRPADNN
ncbi:hypothetical protein [Pseudomonas eucalypticola]|uniref:Lipoprotein n=1 Tax=Pseudomonas eucalypticola TaxID=2599595 RepID=A0A7D5D8C3_9PSED|nr:hypothetical protein [Pseudomonas eucalypticola]QKZ05337.1 hypothetical protein HWQ56_16685 [Pseudomonas eucalypticola]